MDDGMKMLRFYLSNTDKVGKNSLYQTIALEAKSFGLAGATVYKGIMGFGTSSRLVSDTFWMIAEKIPVVIEIIDETDKIERFAEHIKPLIASSPKGCLVVKLDVDVVIQKSGKRT
jgi:PII-like signaling protein